MPWDGILSIVHTVVSNCGLRVASHTASFVRPSSPLSMGLLAALLAGSLDASLICCRLPASTVPSSPSTTPLFLSANILALIHRRIDDEPLPYPPGKTTWSRDCRCGSSPQRAGKGFVNGSSKGFPLSLFLYTFPLLFSSFSFRRSSAAAAVFERDWTLFLGGFRTLLCAQGDCLLHVANPRIASSAIAAKTKRMLLTVLESITENVRNLLNLNL